MEYASRLVAVIEAEEAGLRDSPIEGIAAGLDREELLAEAAALEAFRHRTGNHYHRVRALLFLHWLMRYALPPRLPVYGEPATHGAHIPYDGIEALWQRRFEDAIARFRAEESRRGLDDALASALAFGYRELAFQTLADQVKRSVRAHRGNAWMFEVEGAHDHPLRVRDELLVVTPRGRPLLRERTPVRMDLTHCGWSDIFFLAMDHPEGAAVINASIDLAVRGRDEAPRPPVEAFVRVIDEPLLRLVSLDLEAEAEIRELSEVFDFARDHLGLLKAALIASGVVPPSLEGSSVALDDVLERLVGRGRGLEIASHVRGIPKGSRLAVSTTLLAALIAALMRATSQTDRIEGPLAESERRDVAARAILGEWLGGSGGGWQDSGGLWPGIKRITGALAQPGDPEFGVSRGRLLPDHHVLGRDEISDASRERLRESLVLVHGGLAQNVGPILEMVTERYLLRSGVEWRARAATKEVLAAIETALRDGDMRALGRATHRNFDGPLTAIIPQATNAFTERLIERVRGRFGERFFGFWMLGGMSGGGMGLLFDPRAKPAALSELPDLLRSVAREFDRALPFAMDPVVYDFAIDERGSSADLVTDDAPLPLEYYALRLPRLLRADPREMPAETRAELRRFGRACSSRQDLREMPQILFRELFPESTERTSDAPTLDQLLAENGFDEDQHREIGADLQAGRIGLARNRLPVDVAIEDVASGDVARAPATTEEIARGEAALAAGEVAIVTLAGGAGTRWSQGAPIVKALHPFWRHGGRHVSFIGVHFAKARRTARRFGIAPLHVVTTSYLTHGPIADHLARGSGASSPVARLSRGRSVGLRRVPMERDLRFLWEETSHPLLDERKQRVRESSQTALLGWARAAGEGADYRDNAPLQCLHPVGHWYEVPNLLLNGTLAALLDERPGLSTLLLHNVDTLGADLDPALLGRHLGRGGLSFEVVTRRVEDRGGGLARVNGRARLVESLALPRERDEYELTYYNSMTTWIEVDHLLDLFGLVRDDLRDAARTDSAVRKLARRMPTYVTIKEVRKRWGHGQEDVFPVCQFEKLWSDLTALPETRASYFAVSRARGQQLKDPAQFDAWLRDGSADAVAALCDFRD
jgi:hypothetical protein